VRQYEDPIRLDYLDITTETALYIVPVAQNSNGEKTYRIQALHVSDFDAIRNNSSPSMRRDPITDSLTFQSITLADLPQDPDSIPNLNTKPLREMQAILRPYRAIFLKES
jgi:hypothetical protein